MNKADANSNPNQPERRAGFSVHPLQPPHYSQGQVLSAEDFAAEQEYHRGKHAKRGNICQCLRTGACRIVAELDALQAEVDALKRLPAETAAELDTLLPALLDRAFKGEL